ncbi:MAG TPA: helix-turn-helix domain-containing protein [Stellaceae bacterium]|jgi:AraC-like DNA-binding protein
MTPLNAGLRGGAIALFVLLEIMYLRDAARVPAARYGALFAACGIAYMIESMPVLNYGPCPLWLVPIRMFSACGAAIFQLWAAANFDDGFRPAWWRWLPLAGMAALALWAILADRYIPWRIVNLVALALVVVGLWQTLAGRAADLIEARRRFRLVLAVAVGLAIGSLTLITFFASRWLLSEGTVFSAGLIMLLALGSAVISLTARSAVGILDPAPQPSRSRPAAAPSDPEERALLDTLRRLMETERIYREEGFGVAVLAERMRIPEYRLRRLINQRLGHRNFTGFVNGYRLAETIAALSDASQTQVPILTIALDAGFQSLGPFNRAFKTETGVTPTEFRRLRSEPGAAQ